MELGSQDRERDFRWDDWQLRLKLSNVNIVVLSREVAAGEDEDPFDAASYVAYAESAALQIAGESEHHLRPKTVTTEDIVAAQHYAVEAKHNLGLMERALETKDKKSFIMATLLTIQYSHAVMSLRSRLVYPEMYPDESNTK